MNIAEVRQRLAPGKHEFQFLAGVDEIRSTPVLWGRGHSCFRLTTQFSGRAPWRTLGGAGLLRAH